MNKRNKPKKIITAEKGQLIPTKNIRAKIASLKKKGYKIVLTQGVWDLIHEGHAKYLQKAKGLGDILIVGVDTDSVVKHRKGPNRPIVPEEERIRMLSHLKHVDFIVMKESKTDHGKLIRAVRPDVLVISKTTEPNKKGKTFFEEVKEEHDCFCGEIVNIEPQSTTSTSARIRELTIQGAEDLAKELHEMINKFLYSKRKI